MEDAAAQREFLGKVSRGNFYSNCHSLAFTRLISQTPARFPARHAPRDGRSAADSTVGQCPGGGGPALLAALMSAGKTAGSGGHR